MESQDETYICKICNHIYDESLHIPKIIECGHIFCSECMKKLSNNFQNCYNCPICRKNIPFNSKHFVVHELISLAESKNVSLNKEETCAKHGQRLIFFCNVCKLDICKDCFESSHNDHIFSKSYIKKKIEIKNKILNLKSKINFSILDSFKTRYDEFKQKIEDFLISLNENHSQFCEIYLDQKNQILNIIKKLESQEKKLDLIENNDPILNSCDAEIMTIEKNDENFVDQMKDLNKLVSDSLVKIFKFYPLESVSKKLIDHLKNVNRVITFSDSLNEKYIKDSETMEPENEISVDNYPSFDEIVFDKFQKFFRIEGIKNTYKSNKIIENSEELGLSPINLLEDSLNFINFKAHENLVTYVGEVENGSMLSASMDHTIKLWNPSSGKCVNSSKYSELGKFLYIGNDIFATATKTIKIFMFNNPNPIKTLNGHEKIVTDLKMFKNDLLLSCSEDCTMRLWEISSSKCLKVFNGHTDSITGLTFNNEESLASCSNDKTIRLWNPSGVCYMIINETAAFTSIVSLLGDFMAASTVYFQIIIYNYKNGNQVCILSGHTNKITRMLPLRNGYLASSSYDKTIKIWNPLIGECIKSLESNGKILFINEIQNGHLVSTTEDFSIQLWTNKKTEEYSCKKIVIFFFSLFICFVLISALLNLKKFRKN